MNFEVRTRGKREEDLEYRVKACVDKYLNDASRQNVMSAINIAFVNCYLELECPERYVSLFSKAISERLCKLYTRQRISKYLNEITKYVNEVFKTLSSKFNYVYMLKLEFTTRLLVGTKSPHLPLDIALSWDPILNVPYIPSSTLKGISRSYFEENNIKIGDLLPEDIFGDINSSEIIIFSDAYPTECRGESLIEPDVIAPHYRESENKIDEASASPVPIVFPTVAPGTIFSTIVAFSNSSRLDPLTVQTILEKIMEALTRGIGAKTRLGYGRVRVYRT